MPEPGSATQDRRETLSFFLAGLFFLVVLPVLNVVPADDLDDAAKKIVAAVKG